MITSCAGSNREITSSEIKALEPSGQIVNGIREINVTAERYKFTPDPIIVRAGEKVRVELTSKDTTHGFALSEYNIDIKIESGKTSTAKFTAGKIGEFPIHCSVFCGLGHLSMRATLMVIPADS